MSTAEDKLYQMPRQFEIKNVGNEFAKGYPDVLTMPEVAEILRIGKSAAYDLAKLKHFPSFNFGRSVRVQKAELQRWVREQWQSK